MTVPQPFASVKIDRPLNWSYHHTDRLFNPFTVEQSSLLSFFADRLTLLDGRVTLETGYIARRSGGPFASLRAFLMEAILLSTDPLSLSALCAALRLSLGPTDPRFLRIRLTKFHNHSHSHGGTLVDLPWHDWCKSREDQGRMPAEGAGSPNQRKGRLPVEVGAVLTDCRRKNDTTEEITWFFFDVDSGGATWERLHKTLSDLGVAHLVCDSSTHGVNKDTGEADPSAVRWHAYIALDPPITVPAQGRKGYPERVWHPQYAHVRAALQTLAGVSSADKSVDDLAQSAYVARIPPGGDVRRVKWSNGRGLRWDALLDALDYEAPEDRGKGGAGGASGASNAANPTSNNDRAGLGPKIWRAVQSLKAQGVDLKPTPADNGKVHIVCPWAHEHTTGSNRFGEVSSETSIWIGESDGGFKCQHSHCSGRTVKDFLRWVAKHGILSEDIEERPPSEPAGALLSMNATLRALDNLGLLRELEDTDGLPDKWHGDLHTTSPLFLAEEWPPYSLSSSWRMTWAGGDPAPRHTLLETGGIVPTSGVIACARGVSLLRGDAPISRAVFVRDPADLAVLVALRGKMSDARKDWDDADNTEEMPVFCGDPGILQIMLKPRLAYACVLVLCGYTDRSVERVAASCDLWTLRSPARALRDNGLESGLDAARKISRLGRAPIALLKPLDPTAWHPTTENGLAQRFRDGFYDRVRVLQESDTWKVYTPMGSAGYAWRDDTHAAVGGMAQQIFDYSIPEEIKQLANPDVARTVESWRRRMMARGYNKMLSDAKERDGDGRTLTLPTVAFDERESTKYILNTEGGMLDISSTPVLQSPTPEKYITKIMRVAYTPVDPGCPQWKRSLEQWLRTEQDGPPNRELITYMQALCGYLLTGDISAEKMWIFAGEGANGKSTFCNVIRRILGDYAIQIDPAILMDHGTDKGSPTAMSRKAVLQGIRVALASETGSGERLSSALVKQLASDEPIQAKHMCKNPFTFHPTHKLIMLTNHEPSTDDTGHGAMRRLVIIRWPHRVSDADRVDGLADKLFNEEATGILHWMLEGVKLWRAGYLKDEREPECIRVKRDKYRKDHDWFGQWMEDCIVKAPTGFISGTMVNALFHTWFYSKEGAAPRSAGAARKELRKAGYNESKKYESVGGQKKQVCGFEGLKPNENSEHYLKALEACARMRGE